HFACRGRARAPGTERPFQSKCSPVAKLLQCRASSALSERSNSLRTKSGSQCPRRALRLQVCSKNNAELRPVLSPPPLLPGFSCSPAKRGGNESRAVVTRIWQAPFVAAKVEPECRAVTERKSSAD